MTELIRGASSRPAGRSMKVNVMSQRLDAIEKRLSMVIIEKEELKKKVEFQHKEILQILGYLGDIETRIEAFRFLGTKRRGFIPALFTQDQYDATWDQIKGLRVRSKSEKIEKGDFVRVSYTAKIDGKVIHEETDFPLRIGAGVLLIEDEILGRNSGLKNHEFLRTYPEDFGNKELAGKVVSFTMDIGKVKTRIEVADEPVN